MEMTPPAARGLPPDALRRCCDARQFAFATTAELPQVDAALGQDRALEAIEFGIGMRREGYNLYAMGPEGAGRHTVVRRRLELQAAQRPAPDDWCYVYDFDAAHRPRALRFPAGQASAFRAALERLVQDLLSAIPAAFETDEYRHKRAEIESALHAREERAMEDLGERARADGLAFMRTPSGFAFGPFNEAKDGVLTPEEFGKLPETQRERYEALVAKYREALAAVLQELPRWRREALQSLRELGRHVAGRAIDSLMDELQVAYRTLPEVHAWLLKAREDMLERAEVFRHSKDSEPPTFLGLPLPQMEAGDAPLRRYAVNLLIDHAGAGRAPVVYEDHPTHDALVGRIEHLSQMGALVTDFTLIKAGALHRANGGYLVLDAMKLLTQPLAWEALKRALRSRTLRIQSLGQELSLVSTISLEPEPIPLDVKVVLVGERLLYYLLHAYDREFRELFKVAADFEEDVPRTPDNDLACARTLATFARREGLLPLERDAVARVIDQASREAGDADKISASMQALVDLLREADYWARRRGASVTGAADVLRAIDAQQRRTGRVRERLVEEIVRGSRAIDTAGHRVGQVNGLAVVQLGDTAFGSPHRISARVRLGNAGVVDIEREAKLGGPLHSKGVLILSGYLAGRYARNRPLSLSASLVFEQSYGGIEGDSASSAELYALVSALADVPLSQALAVTGSVDQHGHLQAIGGVNEKIEGFFDLCRTRGLGGEHGVLIPHANVKNLMLREDVVEAVAQGRFAVHAAHTVDEGLALLTGLDADAVHAKVEARLAHFAESARAFGAPVPSRRWQSKREKSR